MLDKGKFSILVLFLCVSLVLLGGAACSSGDDSAAGGRGESGDDDDFIPPSGDDDAGDDDGDNDNDDDGDGDDDVVPPGAEVDDALLEFEPDPNNDGPFYYGQEFEMTLRLYDVDDVYLGATGNYELHIWPDEEGVEYSTEDGTIKFEPPRPTLYSITATATEYDIDSQVVDLMIEYEELADIVLINPPRGLFSEEQSVNVEGTCFVDTDRDPVRCDHVEVDGRETPVDADGYFTRLASLDPGLNRITVSAFSESGTPVGHVNISVLMCENALDDGAKVVNAIAVRVNEGGFDAIEEIALGFLENLDLMDYIPNPLVDEDIGFFSVLLEVTNVGFGEVNVDLDPRSWYTEFTATINNLDIALHGEGTLFDEEGEDGNLIADSIGLSAKVEIFTLPTDGALTVELNDIQVNIDNLRFVNFGDIEIILNTLIVALLPILEDMLPPIIEEEIQPLIEETLNDLDLSGDFDILDVTFSLAADFQDVLQDEDGLTFWLSANFQAQTVDPEVPEMPGSFRIIGQMPTMGAFVPGTSTPYGFGAGLNDDTLNQVLYQVFKSGILGLDFQDDALTTAAWIFFGTQLSQMALFPTPVILRLEPLLQPIITLEGTDSLQTQLALGEYMIHLILDHPTEGELLAFTAATTLIFPIELSVDDQGLLHIDIDPELFDVDITVFNEWGDLNFRSGLVVNIIPTLLEFLIPMLGDLLGGIELPAFEGYTLSIDALEPFGPDMDFIGLFGSLISAE